MTGCPRGPARPGPRAPRAWTRRSPPRRLRRASGADRERPGAQLLQTFAIGPQGRLGDPGEAGAGSSPAPATTAISLTSRRYIAAAASGCEEKWRSHHRSGMWSENCERQISTPPGREPERSPGPRRQDPEPGATPARAGSSRTTRLRREWSRPTRRRSTSAWADSRSATSHRAGRLDAEQRTERAGQSRREPPGAQSEIQSAQRTARRSGHDTSQGVATRPATFINTTAPISTLAFLRSVSLQAARQCPVRSRFLGRHARMRRDLTL
jgi:hypothetical protein